MIAETSARANLQLKSIRICSACGSAVAASVHLRLLTARGDLRASRCLGLLVPQCHADAGGSEEKRVGGQSREQSSQSEPAPPSAPRLASAMLSRAAAVSALTQCASLRSAGDAHCCSARDRYRTAQWTGQAKSGKRSPRMRVSLSVNSDRCTLSCDSPVPCPFEQPLTAARY